MSTTLTPIEEHPMTGHTISANPQASRGHKPPEGERSEPSAAGWMPSANRSSRAPTGGSRPRLAPSFLAAVALLLLAVGCSSVSSPDKDLLKADDTPLATPAVGYRIGVMQLSVAPELDQAAQLTDPKQRSFGVAQDLRRKFADDVVTALGTIKACEDARFISATEGRDLDAILREAWNDGLDIVVRPVIRTHQCKYEGQTDAWVPSLIMWFTVFPSISTWWVGDERFSSETLVALEFYSTARAGAKKLVTEEIKGAVECALDDFDQGLNLFNLFITPGGMSPSAWQDVADRLLPLSRQAAQRDWIAKTRDPQGLAAALGKVAGELEKTLAITCGAITPGARSPRFVDEDARKVAQILQSPLTGSAVDPRGIASLGGLDASADKLKTAITDTFGKHARRGDRLVLSLHCTGVVDEQGRGWLLLSGADPARPAQTGFAVSALADALAARPEGTKLLVLGLVGWRFAGKEPLPGEPTPDPWAPLLKLPGVALLTGDTGDVLEFEQIRGSLIVGELQRALENPDATDADHDGYFTLAELGNAISGPVQAWSTMEGLPQTPRLLGDAALPRERFFRTSKSDSITPTPGPGGNGAGRGSN